VVGVLLRLIDVSASDAVTRALRHAAARLPDLFATDRRLLVAFSGGQDSTCLLHALLEHGLRERVEAAHVDHGLRPESAQQAERVADLAVSMGAAASVLRVDVAAYRASMGSASVQQAARAARYQVLAAAAAEVGAAAVLVGHTADDQAETVLLNLVRGAGLGGLAGMRLSDDLALARLGPRLPDLVNAPERVRLARPLLRVARNTTLAYCAERELAYVEDVSNQSRVYTRNRVRLDLLPLLEQFNPAIREVLARTADLAGEDLAALDSIVAELHARLARPGDDGGLVYDLPSWQTLPRALQRRLLRRGILALRGHLVDVPAAPIEDALDVLTTARPGQSYHLPHGVELRVQQGAILLAGNTRGSVPPSV
jgi:tRNA(Ile)-lysidine synthase